jgi:hypothetical protein
MLHMTVFLPTEDQSDTFLKKTKRHAAYIENLQARKRQQQLQSPAEINMTTFTIRSDDSTNKDENNHSTSDSYDIISSVQSSTNTLSSSEINEPQQSSQQQQPESSPASVDSTNTTTTTDFANCQDSQDTFSSIIKHIEPIKLVEDHFTSEAQRTNQASSETKNSKAKMETSFDEGIGSTCSLSANNFVKNSPIGENNTLSSILQFPKLSPISHNDREDGDFLPKSRNVDNCDELNVDDVDDLDQFDDEADLDVNIDDNETNNLDDDDIDFNDLPTGGMMHGDKYLDEQDDETYGMDDFNSFGAEASVNSNLVSGSMLKDQFKTSKNASNKVKFSDYVNEHPSWDDVPLGGESRVRPPALISTVPEFDYANEVDDTLPSYAELTEKMSIPASGTYDGNSKYMEESSSSKYASSRVMGLGEERCASNSDARYIKSNFITNTEFGTRSN